MRLNQQISNFLSELRGAGAFASVPPDQAFLVICDERINDGQNRDGINVLVQFAATHAGEYHSFMLTHRAGRFDRAAGDGQSVRGDPGRLSRTRARDHDAPGALREDFISTWR